MKEENETRNVAEIARSENRQADEEIEVTPEMIEAGADMLMVRWLELTRPSSQGLFSEVSADLYRAMHRVRR